MYSQCVMPLKALFPLIIQYPEKQVYRMALVIRI